jgi:hypothetical protein
MRKEQDILDELATLCTSPGYVHAIAFLCFRDNIIRYQGEMTAEDMQQLSSPEHLLRTEISTLIGLLIKKDIDYTLPTPDVTQKSITQTDQLLEEMHRAMSNEMFGGRDLIEVVQSGLNPFDLGGQHCASQSSMAGSPLTGFNIATCRLESMRPMMNGSGPTKGFRYKTLEMS